MSGWTKKEWQKFADGVHHYIRECMRPIAEDIRRLERDNADLRERIGRLEAGR